MSNDNNVAFCQNVNIDFTLDTNKADDTALGYEKLRIIILCLDSNGIAIAGTFITPHGVLSITGTDFSEDFCLNYTPVNYV